MHWLVGQLLYKQVAFVDARPPANLITFTNFYECQAQCPFRLTDYSRMNHKFQIDSQLMIPLPLPTLIENSIFRFLVDDLT